MASRGWMPSNDALLKHDVILLRFVFPVVKGDGRLNAVASSVVVDYSVCAVL